MYLITLSSSFSLAVCVSLYMCLSFFWTWGCCWGCPCRSLTEYRTRDLPSNRQDLYHWATRDCFVCICLCLCLCSCLWSCLCSCLCLCICLCICLCLFLCLFLCLCLCILMIFFFNMVFTVSTPFHPDAWSFVKKKSILVFTSLLSVSFNTIAVVRKASQAGWNRSYF